MVCSEALAYTYCYNNQGQVTSSFAPLEGQKRKSVEGSHLWGGTDRTGDPKLTNRVFHPICITLSIKTEGSKGQLSFFNGQCPRRTLPVRLPLILIRAFLTPDLESSSCPSPSPVWDFFPVPTGDVIVILGA
ncbi:hypothetical protein llap_7219 [Limosa lapponica baueri]|uniref:Uncharacterized protein n=1 Tax=Limosa lapponica baueri TaxID=1758121 RepID=A0A2I0U8W2_LIMLA|nr:hypothetical protein llap_7219 [Limosa lapponica baueri]